MNSAIERLLSLRVSDVMSKEVVEVSPQATMQQAAGLLASQELSAAPVVDTEGQCVGILSATDFLLAHCSTEAMESVCQSNGNEAAQHRANASLPLDVAEPDKVEAQMSRTLQTVAADDSLVEAARRMCGVHVHRMPVLDQQGRVQGMISSLDIAAALVKVIEE